MPEAKNKYSVRSPHPSPGAFATRLAAELARTERTAPGFRILFARLNPADTLLFAQTSAKGHIEPTSCPASVVTKELELMVQPCDMLVALDQLTFALLWPGIDGSTASNLARQIQGRLYSVLDGSIRTGAPPKQPVSHFVLALTDARVPWDKIPPRADTMQPASCKVNNLLVEQHPAPDGESFLSRTSGRDLLHWLEGCLQLLPFDGAVHSLPDRPLLGPASLVGAEEKRFLFSGSCKHSFAAAKEQPCNHEH